MIRSRNAAAHARGVTNDLLTMKRKTRVRTKASLTPQEKREAVVAWTFKNVLRIFLGIVFLSAALYRIFHFDSAIAEVQVLHLPVYVSYGIISFELLVGAFFLLNVYFDLALDIALISTIIFIVSAIVLGVIQNWRAIWQNISQLFLFSPTPTDILLHIVYLILLLMLLNETRKPHA